MGDDKPYFRFNPNACSVGREFEASDGICDVCNSPCVWVYKGGIYTGGEEPTVCARCIADGRLATYLNDAHFQLHDIDVDDVDPALEDELLRRTPGISSFNPFPWPVLDRKPLAFLGYGEDERLLSEPDVVTAIEEAFKELGWEFEGPTPYALIFKEVDGKRYRAVVDLD